MCVLLSTVVSASSLMAEDCAPNLYVTQLTPIIIKYFNCE